MKTLVINCGSSSVKYQLFEMEPETLLAKGIVEKIGEGTAVVRHTTRATRPAMKPPSRITKRHSITSAKPSWTPRQA